jgi:hypothetical protein
MSQTQAYGFRLDVAQAGQIYDIRPNTVITLAAEAAIEPGQPVRRGTDPENQALIANATSFEGIAVFTQAQEHAYITGGAEYAIGDAVSVLKRGAIWVTVASDVAAGANAYVAANGTITDVATDNLLIGKFETTALSGALSVLVLG